MPLAVAVVALTAGLAVATFVKAFGVGFLARPRSAGRGGAPPRVAAQPCWPAMGIAAAACVGLALLPDALGCRPVAGGRRGRRHRAGDPVRSAG